MRYYKRILILVFCICISLFLLFFVNIYAKYLSSASGNTTIPIARWNITVNNASITTNTDITSSITPLFPGTEHISEGIIAPTAEGYFDLNFDFSNVDVSFSYLIKTNVNNKSSVQDLVATGYSVDNQEKIEFSNFNEDISDTILLSDNVTSRNIRIYIKWIDDGSATMDNAADSLSTISANPALFDVIVTFTQIATINP